MPELRFITMTQGQVRLKMYGLMKQRLHLPPNLLSVIQVVWPGSTAMAITDSRSQTVLMLFYMIGTTSKLLPIPPLCGRGITEPVTLRQTKQIKVNYLHCLMGRIYYKILQLMMMEQDSIQLV